MKTITTVAFLCALIAGASGAAAEGYEVGILGHTSFMRSSTVDAVSADDAHGGVAFFAEAPLPVLLSPDLQISADLRWDFGEVSGTTFQRLDSQVSHYTFSAGAVAVYRPSSRIRPFARAGLGLTWASLNIQGQGSSSLSVDDSAKAGSIETGIGADVGLISTPGGEFELGIRAEFGYTARTALAFKSEPADRGADELTIDTMATSLGELDLSARTFSMGLIGRF